MKVKCIKDTTVDGIIVGDEYFAEYFECVFSVKYNETETTFETLKMIPEYFHEHFKEVK